MRSNMKLLSLLALCALPLASCGDDGAPVADAGIDAPSAAGTFSLAWLISDGSNTISCDDVGAVSVAVTVLEQGAAGGSVDAFTCDGGEAVSRQFSPGTYDMTINLRASGSRSLIAAPVQLRDIEINDGAVTALPEQTFVVAPTGSFTFTVNTQASAGNCETVANSGAEITGLVFGLEDKDGVCVAATFNVAKGADVDSVAGMYTSDCTTPPAPHGCIDADQLVTVDPIASGPLVLTVTGQTNRVVDPFDTVDCYDRVSSFSVAGATLQTELGSLSMALEYSLACDIDFIML
jgi:hypothetical protein